MEITGQSETRWGGGEHGVSGARNRNVVYDFGHDIERDVEMKQLKSGTESREIHIPRK